VTFVIEAAIFAAPPIAIGDALVRNSIDKFRRDQPEIYPRRWLRTAIASLRIW
jgi:hypothetical protein